MNALNRESLASMIRRVLVVTLATFALVSAQACSSAAQADCILQVPGFGGYAVKMTLQGTTPGCPPTIGDTWYTDLYGGAQGTWIWNSGSDDGVSTPRLPADTAFGRGKFVAQFPDNNNNCTMTTITPFTVNSSTPNSAPTGTYAVTDMQVLNTAIYAGQQFVAKVVFTGGTCTGGTYIAQGMAPPVQCTTGTASVCDPFAQPPNAINTGFNQGCDTGAWAFQSAVAVNKTLDNYFCVQGDPDNCVGGDPDLGTTGPANIPQPDPGTGVCFLKAAYPSLGSYSK